MAVEVSLTNAQAVRVCALIGKVSVADFQVMNHLEVTGHDLRVLRNAAVRIAVTFIEDQGVVLDAGLQGKLFKLLLEQLSDGDRAHDA